MFNKKSISSDGDVNKYHSEEFALLLIKKYMPYAPLWTNIMGHFVETENTRVSNSPVESYFSSLKTKILHGKVVRTSDYVRKSYVYKEAKCNEIENFFPEVSKPTKGKKVKLDENIWLRTPKREENKKSKMQVYEILLSKYQKLPRNKKAEGNHTMFKFSSIYNKLSYKNVCDVISFEEFKSLEGTKRLYNVIVDTTIAILICTHQSQTKIYSTTCEVGQGLFYSQNDIALDVKKYDQVFIPIIYRSHYTLVYLDVTRQYFCYIDPLGENESYCKKLLNIFERKTNEKDWEIKLFEHDFQQDLFNCGVFVCQFVQAIITKNKLTGLCNPNRFRETIKGLLTTYSDDSRDFCLHCGFSRNLNIFCNTCKRPVCEGCFKHTYSKSNLTLLKCKLCD